MAFVQVCNTAGSGSSIISQSCTFSVAQTIGNFNFVVCLANGGASLTSATVKDSAGNPYTLIGSKADATPAFTQFIFYSAGISGWPAGNVVTATLNISSTFFYIAACEYSGVAGPTSLDVSGSATGSSTGPITASVTTTNANDLLVYAVMSEASTLNNGGNSVGTQRLDANASQGIADVTLGSAGAQSPSWTLSATSVWVIQVAAFKLAGSAGNNAFYPPNPVFISGGTGVSRIGVTPLG